MRPRSASASSEHAPSQKRRAPLRKKRPGLLWKVGRRRPRERRLRQLEQSDVSVKRKYCISWSPAIRILYRTARCEVKFVLDSTGRDDRCRAHLKATTRRVGVHCLGLGNTDGGRRGSPTNTDALARSALGLEKT
jgi:hypothetical protein